MRVGSSGRLDRRASRGQSRPRAGRQRRDARRVDGKPRADHPEGQRGSARRPIGNPHSAVLRRVSPPAPTARRTRARARLVRQRVGLLSQRVADLVEILPSRSLARRSASPVALAASCPRAIGSLLPSPGGMRVGVRQRRFPRMVPQAIYPLTPSSCHPPPGEGPPPPSSRGRLVRRSSKSDGGKRPRISIWLIGGPPSFSPPPPAGSVRRHPEERSDRGIPARGSGILLPSPSLHPERGRGEVSPPVGARGPLGRPPPLAAASQGMWPQSFRQRIALVATDPSVANHDSRRKKPPAPEFRAWTRSTCPGRKILHLITEALAQARMASRPTS